MQVIILDIDVAIYHDMVGGDMARVTSLGNGPIYHMQVIMLDIDVCCNHALVGYHMQDIMCRYLSWILMLQ